MCLDEAKNTHHIPKLLIAGLEGGISTLGDSVHYFLHRLQVLLLHPRQIDLQFGVQEAEEATADILVLW